MFVSNKRPSFHMCSKKNLVKHRKVSKYYETGCLQIFLLTFLLVLTTNFVKKGHIQARILFMFLKGVLNQTFNTKFVIQ